MEQTEGMDTAGVPVEEQTDYAVFAQRCSKCHSLARPLNSGITDDGYWRMYVEKMRRQPASGISEADRAPILRFLHWYSVSQKQKADGG
jgi:mono/diheme cytochrome c family protein